MGYYSVYVDSTAAMWTVAASMWAITASMGAVIVSMWDFQAVTGAVCTVTVAVWANREKDKHGEK